MIFFKNENVDRERKSVTNGNFDSDEKRPVDRFPLMVKIFIFEETQNAVNIDGKIYADRFSLSVYSMIGTMICVIEENENVKIEEKI